VSQHSALIIDDEPDIRQLIAITLERMELECVLAGSFSEALEQLQKHTFHFCITDMKLPDGNGLDLIRLCQSRFSDMPVAMITAHGNMDMAVDALKAGAFDFVAKPLDIQRLRDLVRSAIQLTRVPTHLDKLPSNDALLGSSAVMKQLNAQIQKVARTQAPIFVHGESGTGKELVARLIHHQSPRNEHPFIPVNCGAVPKDLMESEFFGHRKGAFTGAQQDKEGFFRAAKGGTLFLDEVAELPLSMQAKLLRAIQEKAVLPVGEETEVAVDFRILCASHKDLGALVDQGRFRQDLFFRLDVIRINVPGLRDRPEDIPALAMHFTQKYSSEWGMPTASLSADALSALMTYTYPGNVRELENIIQRAVTLSEGDLIQASDLNLPLLNKTTASSGNSEASANHSSQSGQSNLAASATTEDLVSGNSARLPQAEQEKIDTNDLEAYLENIERNAIVQALESTRWNKTAAAEKLGLSFRALRYRCKKLSIE
jgi:two-component system response regulator PilR (NtrC family)